MQSPSVLPKSNLGVASRYVLRHWEALCRFTEDATIPIDNNDCEQLMKRVATGRKNWMFKGSVAAGEGRVASPILHDRQFGILIAYVIPGFIVVNGLAYHWPTVATWLATGDQPSVGGFLYVTLASTACGLSTSTLRWLLIDTLLHRTGVQKAQWRLSELREQLPAFEMFVIYTYRYYRFHANCVVALPAWFVLRSLHDQTIHIRWLVGLVLAEAVLLVGARDTLKKYYARTNEVLREQSRVISIGPDQ